MPDNIISNYAQIANGKTEVVNKIVADDGFELEGYYLVKIEDGIWCDIGSFYNKKDGIFYLDDKFNETISVKASK